MGIPTACEVDIYEFIGTLTGRDAARDMYKASIEGKYPPQ